MANLPRFLQCLLNQVGKYAYTLEIHYNPRKRVFIVFNKTQICSVYYSITLFGSEISQSNNTVYSGCLLQANVKTDTLTERMSKAARSKINLLYSIGDNNSDIHPVVSAKIWKRVVLPSALYSCEIWSSLTLTEMQLLEYVQSHFSRIYICSVLFFT